MKRLSSRLCVFAALCFPLFVHADGWKNDPIWHDGLVEKAVYSASRTVYGKPRPYTATFFTNKEQHDAATLTKADKAKETIEVWKHNQIEDIPTPNYTYHYVTTSHLSVDRFELTRMDSSSQEFCGTSFKQYLGRAKKSAAGWAIDGWDYWSFSYMPEAGRRAATVAKSDRPVVAENALQIYLREFDFASKGEAGIALLPSQKSNRATAPESIAATLRYAGEENAAHKIELVVEKAVRATYWMAADRLHVMTKYAGPEGQTYELTEVSRVNYWTIKDAGR
ncbi:MAG: hypothetical protein JWN40_4726 [Phycisphaerales bacterium]|nr:hypothetical protein [Phycisphaerales bacterium]